MPIGWNDQEMIKEARKTYSCQLKQMIVTRSLGNRR